MELLPFAISLFRRVCPVAILLLCLHSSNAPGQTLYNYVRIDNPDFIRPGGLGSDTGAPSLNASGRVAFGGSDINNRFGIFSGDGSETDENDYVRIAINPAVKPVAIGSYVGSRVAFSGSVNGKDGIYNSDGVNIETIVQDASINNGQFRRPLMNSSRKFPYFRRDSVKNEFGLYVAQNGSSNVVYKLDSSTRRGVLQFRGVFESDAAPIVISDAGDLYFDGVFGCLENNPPQPNDCQDEVEGIIKGNGGPPTLLVREGTIDAAGTFVSIDGLAVSSSGTLASVVSLSDDVGLYYRLSNGSSPVTDTRAGPFSFLGEVAVNNGGSIVFRAEYRDSAGKFREGLFNGPDLVRNKIIAVGDPLFGSTVVSFSWTPLGFNNAGQVAFFANLATGKTAIVRADPIEGGTQVEWIHGTGGAFAEVTNWKPLNGDPPRVPDKTATLSDTALFDLSIAYTVDVGTRHSDRLIVRNGDVIFEDGTYLVDHLAPDAPAVVIDRGRLTLLTGMLLTNNHALIGETAGVDATVRVGFGGKWHSSSLAVGRGGHGILEVNAAGTVISAESLIGDGPGDGQVTIKDTGSWNTGNLAVGAVGKGSLTIQDGGNVKSDQAFIGHAPGTDHIVTVQGTGADRSTWSTSELTVAERGDGTLEVKGGASVLAGLGSIRIADTPGVMGSVKVNGVGPNSVPSVLFGIGLSVGAHGDGSLIVEEGGSVEINVNAVSIGSSDGGVGSIVVRGTHAPSGEASTLTLGSLPEQEQTFSIVRGKMRVEAGGQVKSRGGAITPGTATAANEAIIKDAASLWKIEETLFVGGQLVDVNSQNGHALLTLFGGTVQAGSVFLGAGGVIQGDGTIYVPDPQSSVQHSGGTLEAGVQVLESELPLAPLGPANGTGGSDSSRSLRTAHLLTASPPAVATNVLTIAGNYDQSPGAQLLIVVSGTNSTDYGRLIVTNAARLDGDLVLRFVNGFAPKTGDHFDFLSVGGASKGSFATVKFENLGPGFQSNVVTNGPGISLIALNDGVFVAPLQGQIQTSNVVTTAGISYLPYTLAVTNSCMIVETAGGVTRRGPDLFQTLTHLSDPNCRETSAKVSRVLALGELDPGNYQFHFVTDGVIVHTLPFVVPADTGRALRATRTPGGELRLEITGLNSVQYTIQFSTDLRNWSSLPAHVGTFLGPYTVFESLDRAGARFYRLKVQ